MYFGTAFLYVGYGVSFLLLQIGVFIIELFLFILVIDIRIIAKIFDLSNFRKHIVIFLNFFQDIPAIVIVAFLFFFFLSWSRFDFVILPQSDLLVR